MTISEVPYSPCVMYFKVAQSYNDILLYMLQNCQMEQLCETWDVEVLMLVSTQFHMLGMF
jgi:hypothetical protein